MGKWLAILTLCLAGCVGDSHQSQTLPPPAHADVVDIPLDVARLKDLKQLKDEQVSSTNAVQNSITGFGANVGQLANELSGVKGDLSAFKTKVDGDVSALKNTVTGDQSVLKAQVSGDIALLKSDINVKANEINGLKAQVHDLTLQLNTSVTANATLAAKLEQTTSNLTASSGRDTKINNWPPEAVRTLQGGYDEQLSEIKIFAGIISGITGAFVLIIGRIFKTALALVKEMQVNPGTPGKE